ncbi:hypothetical protein HAZT_HAZT003260 [Hyalella azteca]|uniref:SMP-30/Gluconolactonase/LRE-like region domain-containing protein n=1 Tax=Hyalella azteca TaxID=294128 RepID=A0A6A0HBG5_HYAAZ|nr:hypothetical protein HAZT_HAZT003260 [Hyalella azteca]
MMNGPPDVRSSYKDEDVYKLASQLATFNVSNTSSLALPVDDFQAQFTLGAVGDSSSGYLSGYSDLPSSSGAASKSGSGSSSASLSHMDDDLRQHGNGRKHGSRQRAFDMLTSSKEYLQLGDISTQDFVGVYKASITLNGTHVSGSPCTIMVDAQHKYQAVSYVKAVIEGDLMKTFTFSEPWGVCCDTAGVVFISDRGNHTIRVFKPNYVYSHCIGSHGTMPGELNKPAGITCDDQDHVVVADKDNHRIQVFDIQGQVLLAFGEQGHNCHQLNYPWDVATEPQGSILVTDSRKGRVAIFSGDGIFLRDIGADSQILRNPRGICYRSQDDKIITTDMTKHQIIVLDLTPGNSGADTSLSNHPSLIGRKGSNPNELNRPQGITCDQEGNVIVCDSRNCRIQIFDADANYVNHWPVPSPEPSRQAQPAGVAVTPAGNILVVDAELNRVLIY